TFNSKLGVRILVQDLDDVNHYRSRFSFDGRFTSIEQDSPCVVVQLLLNFFSYFWATVVGNSTGNVWTLIIFVKNTVTVSIWPRASVVGGRTSFVRTLVILIGNTVTISIRTST